MSGFTGVMVAESIRYTYTNVAGSVSVSLIGGGSTSVTCTVRRDGTWQLTTGTGTPSISPSGSQNWVLPQNATSGDTRWIRMTVNSGTAPTGLTAGTWTQLNTDRAVVLTAGPASTFDANITLDIATDSGGSNIVSSGVVVMHADND